MRTAHNGRLPVVTAIALSLSLPACAEQADPAPLDHGDSDSTLAADAARADAAGEERPGEPTESFEYSTDWFSHNIALWSSVLEPYKGKPDLRYLEIGVFEGRSLLWMLANVLTHPSSELTGIDIEISETLLTNLERSGRADRVTLIRGPSQLELRKLPPESFDIIYVDGSHTADDVLADAVLSWELLKTGGVLIFDDYKWNGAEMTGEGPLPAELVPRPAIDAFVQAYRREIRELHEGYQVILQKEEDPCRAMKGHCSPFHAYLYDWRAHRLLLPDDTVPIVLSDRERELIEKILSSGSIDAAVGSDGSSLRMYERMRDRLGLDDPPSAAAPADG